MVIGCGQKDKVYQQRMWFLWGWGNKVWSDCSKDTDKGCGFRDRVIGMKGTGKGCGSSGDGVTRCGQRDKGYWQTLGTGCCKVKGTDIGCANERSLQVKHQGKGHMKVKYFIFSIIFIAHSNTKVK